MSETSPPPIITTRSLQSALDEAIAERDAALERERKLRAELEGVQEMMLNVYRNTKGILSGISLTPEQIDSMIAMLMGKASVKR